MISRIIIKLLKKLKILQHLNFTIKHPTNNKISIPIQNEIGYDFLYPSEEWLDYLLKILFQSEFGKDTFVDIGVNIGQTLVKVKSINPDQFYIGFEPNPNCLSYIYKLIKKNQFKNTAIFPFAISQNTGIINLEIGSDTDPSASIIHNFRVRKTAPIAIATCDKQLVNTLITQKLSIIKIDVEGSEFVVIEAMLPKITIYRPLIICEILPVYSHENNSRLERQLNIEKILKSLNYKILQINSSLTFTIINEIGIHGDISRTNYLFCPTECLARINKLLMEG